MFIVFTRFWFTTAILLAQHCKFILQRLLRLSPIKVQLKRCTARVSGWFPKQILVMLQKSGEKSTWDVWETMVNNGINYRSLNWLAGFLNHQQYGGMELTTATLVLTSTGQWNPMDVFWERQDPSSILVQASGACVCMCILVFDTLPWQLYVGLYGYVLPAEEIGSKQRSFWRCFFWYQIKSQHPQPTCCMSLCLPWFTYSSHTTVVLMYPFWTPCRDRWFHCSSGLAASSSSLVVGSLKETRHDYTKHGWKC